MRKQVKQVWKKVSDVRPRHKKDYYRAGRWLVSRRLLYWLCLGVCLICIWFIAAALPEETGKKSGGYPVYRYNSPMLKLHSGKVGITTKSGYTAYIGEVEKGAAQGKGSLYRKDGSLVYSGEFDKNQYHGEGSLYRENGIKSYSGSFQRGKKQGKGSLYNENGRLSYTGNFLNDDILFEELAGQKTEEAAESYQGPLVVYNNENMIFAHMTEIDALYCAEHAGDTMEGGWEITAVYILKDRLPAGGGFITTAAGLDARLGEPEYAGTTRARPAEVTAINCLSDAERIFGKLPRLEAEAELKDVFQVSETDPDYEIYIRTYLGEGLYYTFFGKDRESGFSFYMIQPEG